MPLRHRGTQSRRRAGACASRACLPIRGCRAGLSDRANLWASSYARRPRTVTFGVYPHSSAAPACQRGRASRQRPIGRSGVIAYNACQEYIAVQCPRHAHLRASRALSRLGDPGSGPHTQFDCSPGGGLSMRLYPTFLSDRADTAGAYQLPLCQTEATPSPRVRTPSIWTAKRRPA
jgi:hypothetical protein